MAGLGVMLQVQLGLVRAWRGLQPTCSAHERGWLGCLCWRVVRQEQQQQQQQLQPGGGALATAPPPAPSQQCPGQVLSARVSKGADGGGGGGVTHHLKLLLSHGSMPDTTYEVGCEAGCGRTPKVLVGG